MAIEAQKKDADRSVNNLRNKVDSYTRDSKLWEVEQLEAQNLLHDLKEDTERLKNKAQFDKRGICDRHFEVIEGTN